VIRFTVFSKTKQQTSAWMVTPIRPVEGLKLRRLLDGDLLEVPSLENY